MVELSAFALAEYLPSVENRLMQVAKNKLHLPLPTKEVLVSLEETKLIAFQYIADLFSPSATEDESSISLREFDSLLCNVMAREAIVSYAQHWLVRCSHLSPPVSSTPS